MFKQDAHSVSTNPLRKSLIKKGYSVRAAAKALNINLTELSYLLKAHDHEYDDLPERIEDLPTIKPTLKAD